MKHQMLRLVLAVILAVIMVSSLLGCNLIKLPQVQGVISTLTASAGKQATAAPKGTISGKATVVSKAATGTATPKAGATAVPKATTASEATAVTKATVKPKASATPAPQAQSLVLKEQGFGQQDTEVAYGVVIENPGDSAIIDSQYQVTVYDAEGTILDTEQDNLALVLPGQSLNVAGDLYLSDGQVADRIEITLSSGEATDAAYSTPLSTDKMVYVADSNYSVEYAVVNNPFDQEITDLIVWGVAYDDAGNIVGGGYTNMSFIMAGASSGVEFYITSKSDSTVARVELSAALANSTPYDDSSQRVGAEDVSLANQGFGQVGTQVGYGTLLENASASAAEYVDVHFTLYTDNGDVITVDDNSISLILPGESQAVVGSTNVPDGVNVGSVDVQYRVGQMEEVSDLQSLTSENVNYIDDQYSPKVTGEVMNPYDKKLENVQVTVVAYDANNVIIGGGSSSVDFINPNDKAAVEVYVSAAGVPDHVEMYASAAQLSDLTG